MGISNSLGARLKIIVDEEINIGYYEIPFYSNELASGVYFYRLIILDNVLIEKDAVGEIIKATG